MSNKSALTDLAEFVAKSPLASEDASVRRAVINSLKESIEYRPMHRRVSDLLGVVMALSARTRRIVQPRVHVDIDVFSPKNGRAVVISLAKPAAEAETA